MRKKENELDPNAQLEKQPFNLWQTADQCAGADVIADLPLSHKQVQRASLAVADGVEFGVHATFGPANQASTPPFFTPRLVAVRWAFR